MIRVVFGGPGTGQSINQGVDKTQIRDLNY